MRHATALHLGYAQKIICRTHDKQDINREKPTNNSIPRRGTDYLAIFSCICAYYFVSLQVSNTNLIRYGKIRNAGGCRPQQGGKDADLP